MLGLCDWLVCCVFVQESPRLVRFLLFHSLLLGSGLCLFCPRRRSGKGGAKYLANKVGRDLESGASASADQAVADAAQVQHSTVQYPTAQRSTGQEKKTRLGKAWRSTRTTRVTQVIPRKAKLSSEMTWSFGTRVWVMMRGEGWVWACSRSLDLC